MPKKSSGHKHIGSLLKQLNFICREEYSVQKLDPSTQVRGWYDWAILDLRTVIEVHGQQHHKATVFGACVADRELDQAEQAVSNLESQKLRDSAKERIADKAGWGYVAIWDDELGDITLDKLLDLIIEASSTSAPLPDKPVSPPKSAWKLAQEEKARLYRHQRYDKMKKFLEQKKGAEDQDDSKSSKSRRYS